MFRKTVSFAALVLGGGLASAGVTQVFSPDSWAGSGFSVENFEDDSFVPGVAFSSSSGVRRGSSFAYSGGNTCSGDFGLTTNGYPDSITVKFDGGVDAAGVYFGNDDFRIESTPFDVYMDIFDGTELIGTVSLRANMNDYCDQFLGFSSDRKATSVNIRYGTKGAVPLYVFLDDFYFGTFQAVPLPLASAAGLVGLGMVVTRRRR